MPIYIGAWNRARQCGATGVRDTVSKGKKGKVKHLCGQHSSCHQASARFTLKHWTNTHRDSQATLAQVKQKPPTYITQKICHCKEI